MPQEELLPDTLPSVKALPSSERPLTVADALVDLFRNPRKSLWNQWNWKSALFSSAIRAILFFFSNLKSGMHAAVGAMLAEFIYRAITAGFYGAITQKFRRAEPEWLAAIVATVLVPICSHSIELTIHMLRGTPNLKTSLIVSVIFTIISTLFNLYSMRRGALIVGENAGSVATDLKNIPGLIVGFVASGPRFLFGVITNRLVADNGRAFE
jgi:hypothetical protein